MKVTVATVMPQSIRGKAEYANLETALKSINWLKRSKIISLPEDFPVPTTGLLIGTRRRLPRGSGVRVYVVLGP